MFNVPTLAKRSSSQLIAITIFHQHHHFPVIFGWVHVRTSLKLPSSASSPNAACQHNIAFMLCCAFFTGCVRHALKPNCYVGVFMLPGSYPTTSTCSCAHTQLCSGRNCPAEMGASRRIVVVVVLVGFCFPCAFLRGFMCVTTTTAVFRWLPLLILCGCVEECVVCAICISEFRVCMDLATHGQTPSSYP